MLQRDYILDMINRFCDAIRAALEQSLTTADSGSIEQVEQAVGQLLDLDGPTAMSLAPASIVTMMELSGVADSVAGYAAYSLRRLSDAYKASGQTDVAAVRLAQSNAIADAFGCPRGQVPAEFMDMERRLSQGQE